MRRLARFLAAALLAAPLPALAEPPIYNAWSGSASTGGGSGCPTSGTLTIGNFVQFDASGNCVASGFDAATIGNKVVGLPDSAIQDVKQNSVTSAPPRGAVDFVSAIVTDDTSGNAKKILPYAFVMSSADFTGTNVLTAQPIFETALDTFTAVASTTYEFEANVHIHTTGTASHQLGFLFGGTATYTSVGYMASCAQPATETFSSQINMWVAVATVTNIGTAQATATHHTCLLKGVLRVNGAGTIIPQYQWAGTAPGVAGVTLANSFFKIWVLGTNTATFGGAWN